jgi:N-acetylmuramoyl-L-alanine amidase
VVRPFFRSFVVLALAAGCAGESAQPPDPIAALEANRPSLPGGGVQALRIEHFQRADHARVVIHFNAPIQYRVSDETAGGDATIAVDFPRATPTFDARGLTLEGFARRFAIETGPSGMRVVIEPQAKLQQRVFHLPEPFRVVIDLARRVAPARTGRQLQRVMIDPGHGGHDPGAVGAGGLREKDVALDVAHRVAPVLLRQGLAVSLTRDGDEFVSHEERTLRANASGADLFVSIHCNASDARGQHGVETYVLDTSRDSVANLVAARENASSAAASAELGGILSSMRMADQSQRSVHLAKLLQRSAVAALGLEHRHVRDGGVKRAAFNVLVGARMPSVLFETSYISNPQEEGRLGSDRYRARLADAIVNAVRAYREGR